MPAGETKRTRDTDPESPWILLAIGAAGGAAPTLTSLCMTAASGSPMPPMLIQMVAGAVGLALVGIIMVVVHKERNRSKAFFLGASAPGLILAFGAGVTPAGHQDRSPPGEVAAWLSAAVFPAAHAQVPTPEDEAPVPAQGQPLGPPAFRHAAGQHIAVQQEGDKIFTHVTFITDGDTGLEETTIPLKGSVMVTPANAVALSLAGEGHQSRTVPLSGVPGEEVTVEATSMRRWPKLSGFLRALGVNVTPELTSNVKVQMSSRDPSSHWAAMQPRASATFKRMGADGGRIYDFAIWFEGDRGTFEAVERVTYMFHHDSFKDAYVSEDAQTGFRVSYTGWGCLNRVDAKIQLEDGQMKSVTFNQCAAMKR